MCAYVCVHIYVCIQMCAYVMCAYVCVHIYVCIHMCAYLSAQLCTHSLAQSLRSSSMPNLEENFLLLDQGVDKAAFRKMGGQITA